MNEMSRPPNRMYGPLPDTVAECQVWSRDITARIETVDDQIEAYKRGLISSPDPRWLHRAGIARRHFYARRAEVNAHANTLHDSKWQEKNIKAASNVEAKFQEAFAAEKRRRTTAVATVLGQEKATQAALSCAIRVLREVFDEAKMVDVFAQINAARDAVLAETREAINASDDAS